MACLVQPLLECDVVERRVPLVVQGQCPTRAGERARRSSPNRGLASRQAVRVDRVESAHHGPRRAKVVALDEVRHDHVAHAGLGGSSGHINDLAQLLRAKRAVELIRRPLAVAEQARWLLRLRGRGCDARGCDARCNRAHRMSRRLAPREEGQQVGLRRVRGARACCNDGRVWRWRGDGGVAASQRRGGELRVAALRA